MIRCVKSQHERGSKDMPTDLKKYPMIGISIIGPLGLVVLFWAPKVGVVLLNGDSSHDIGYLSNEWAMDGFSPYNEPLTIRNAT